MFLICLIYWGRDFCFLYGDGAFYVLEPLKMFLDVLGPLGMVLDVLDPLRMVFDVLDWGKSLLSLTKDSFLF